MAAWQDYLKLLGELGRTVGQLAVIEQEKTGAVSRGDVSGVDECMKREQALSMSLRGMDQRREKLLDQLGLKDVPLREVADYAPEELIMDVKTAAEAVRSQYALFQAASQVARDTLECHLRAIEKAQAGADGVAPPQEDHPPQADFRI